MKSEIITSTIDLSDIDLKAVSRKSETFLSPLRESLQTVINIFNVLNTISSEQPSQYRAFGLAMRVSLALLQRKISNSYANQILAFISGAPNVGEGSLLAESRAASLIFYKTMASKILELPLTY